MAKPSAGLVMCRLGHGQLEVLLVHPGGPFWAKKDLGAWSIPKGEVPAGEDPLSAAKREFEEELGFAPHGEFLALGTVTQKAGKTVEAWAFEGSCDSREIRSNTFRMEWPPRSGKQQEFPEIDRAEFFRLEEATQKVNPAQVELLKRLQQVIPPADP